MDEECATVPIYGGGEATHYTVEVVQYRPWWLTTRTSRDVVLNVSSRSRHSNVSVSASYVSFTTLLISFDPWWPVKVFLSLKSGELWCDMTDGGVEPAWYSEWAGDQQGICTAAATALSASLWTGGGRHQSTASTAASCQAFCQNSCRGVEALMLSSSSFLACTSTTKHQSQSGRFWATSIASFRETLLDFRSCRIVFIHVVRGRPGGIL